MPAKVPGRLLRCVAAVMALVAMASHAVAGATAQQGPPSAAEDKKKKSEEEKGSRATLKVRVVLVDSERKQAPQNAENATVKIKGEDEVYKTAKDGTTRSVAIAPGVKTLIVRVSGANPCNDVTVSVKEGAQLVTVLVQQVPEVKCILQPASE
jgi:hypothetical protein